MVLDTRGRLGEDDLERALAVNVGNRASPATTDDDGIVLVSKDHVVGFLRIKLSERFSFGLGEFRDDPFSEDS